MWKNTICLLILAATTTPSYHALEMRAEEYKSPAIFNSLISYSSAPTSADMKNITKCGGSLRSPYGRIEYKQSEEVASNERCVWILQPTGYNYAEVLLNPDTPAPDPESLLVTRIYLNSIYPDISVGSIIPTTSVTTLYSANMLVVTFTTTSVPTGRGFSLIYGFGYNSSYTTASANSANSLSSFELGYIRHPILQSEFIPDYDLSVFIVVPDNKCASTDNIRLRYSKIQLSTDCNDEIFLYEFDRPLWRRLDRFCSEVDTKLVTSQDLLMLVSRSIDNNQPRGFELVYAVC